MRKRVLAFVVAVTMIFSNTSMVSMAVEKEIQPETKTSNQAETEVETEPETEAETEPETEAETEPETEVETEPETEVETEPETEVETESETEADTETEAAPELIHMETEQISDFDMSQEGDELIDFIVDDMFGEYDDSDIPMLYSLGGSAYLKGPKLDLYNRSLSHLKDTSMHGGSTKVDLTWNNPYMQYLKGKSLNQPASGNSEVMELMVTDAMDILAYIASDHPEYLYWSKGSVYVGFTAVYQDSQKRLLCDSSHPSRGYIQFGVSEPYQKGSNEYIVDASKITLAETAKKNANDIANRIRSDTSLDTMGKLNEIKNTICQLTSYNHEAAKSGWNGGHDPWQIVWVFDDLNSPDTTKVVCEGYAKAFQYLCNLVFDPSEVNAICVSGKNNRGSHMWNVVRMNGENFLVDITACDTSDHGPFDGFFMANQNNMPDIWKEVIPGEKYETIAPIKSGNSSFIPKGRTLTYNADTKNRYGSEILTLGKTSKMYMINAHGASIKVDGKEVLQASAGSTVTLTASPENFLNWEFLIPGVKPDLTPGMDSSTVTFTMPEYDIEIKPVYSTEVKWITIPKGTVIVPEPIPGKVLETEVAGNKYKVMISWSGITTTEEKVQYDTTYVANVTMIPDYGYRFKPDTVAATGLTSAVLDSDGNITGTKTFTSRKANLLSVVYPSNQVMSEYCSNEETILSKLGTTLPKVQVKAEDGTTEIPVIWSFSGTFDKSSGKSNTFHWQADTSRLNPNGRKVEGTITVKNGKANITAVTIPEDYVLTEHYNSKEKVCDKLSSEKPMLLIEAEDGTESIRLVWSCDGAYSTEPNAVNTFTWHAITDNLNPAGCKVNGTIRVTNASSVSVVHTGHDKEMEYAGRDISIRTMFEKDRNSGTASYEILPEGTTGVAVLDPATGMLKPEKAGKFKIRMTTLPMGIYKAGSADAILTVNKGKGNASVSVSNKVYNGNNDLVIRVASNTNGTDHVTYHYYSADDKGYDDTNAPSDLGNYKVTATFASTDLYESCQKDAYFRITEKPIPTPGGGGFSGGSGSSGGGSSSGGKKPSKPAQEAGNSAVPSGSVSGSWTQNADGSWGFTGNGRNYTGEWAYVYNPYAVEGQETADWFRFDNAGRMITGWYCDENGQWFYLNPVSDGSRGCMKTGWVLIDNIWFYLNPVSDGTRGMMKTGWQWVKAADGREHCYYLNPVSDGTRGRLYTNCMTPDGFMVDGSGAWVVDGKIQTR